MQNLMMDLLDFAQIENNCFKLNKEYYSLFELIHQSFLILDHISKKKNITFVLPSLPKD
jgi:hypothetical protein